MSEETQFDSSRIAGAAKGARITAAQPLALARAAVGRVEPRYQYRHARVAGIGETPRRTRGGQSKDLLPSAGSCL